MIKNFKDNPMRQSGVIYDGSLEQIKMIHAMDAELAGELAISIIELTLTGEISSDNPIIAPMVALQAKVVAKDKQKYETKVAAAESKKYERLSEIADLYNRGFKQKEIAELLHRAPSTISESLSQIREEYPELLKPKKSSENSVLFGEVQSNSSKFVDFNHVTVTDNVNVNDNVTVTDNVAAPMTAEDRRNKLIKGLM